MKLDDFISRIEKRPGMYFLEDDVSMIETMIYGYQQAIFSHKLENDTMTFNHDFNDYLYEEYNWSTARGWANAIIDNFPKGERFNIFLKLYKEFRATNA